MWPFSTKATSVESVAKQVYFPDMNKLGNYSTLFNYPSTKEAYERYKASGYGNVRVFQVDREIVGDIKGRRITDQRGGVVAQEEADVFTVLMPVSQRLFDIASMATMEVVLSPEEIEAQRERDLGAYAIAKAAEQYVNSSDIK